MIDQALDGAVTALRQDGEFTGKPSNLSHLHTQGRLEANKLVLAGLGSLKNRREGCGKRPGARRKCEDLGAYPCCHH
jgi:hypothetical protein